MQRTYPCADIGLGVPQITFDACFNANTQHVAGRATCDFVLQKAIVTAAGRTHHTPRLFG